MQHFNLLDLREIKRAPADFNQIRLDGSFEGYASVFNAVDLGNDIIEPGAFTASLKRRGNTGVRMLFQHDANEPIGVWQRIEETPLGLKVQGKLTLASTKAKEVHALMREGAIDGLSIGFRTIKAGPDRATNARRILEADLWEISVVTFPMQDGARISSVKSLPSTSKSAHPKPTIREFEHWLVRDAGLSRSDARLVITKGYRNCLNQRDAVGKSQGLVARIRAATNLLQTNAPQ